MVEQVWSKPDIYQIKVPLPDNPLKYLNSYVIHSDGAWLIIDTGFRRPECQNALLAGIHELGIDLKQAKLFLTHLHSDHVGLVGCFASSHIPIYMNAVDHMYLQLCLNGRHWAYLEQWFVKEGFPQEQIPYQKLGNQARLYAPTGLFSIIPVEDGSIPTVGSCILRCIHTPGHTPGHTCLYLPDEQILFSGDHILFDITPNITVWMGQKDPLADYLQSLDHISGVPVKITFPGHRAREGGIQDRVLTLKEHHHTRLCEMRDLLAGEDGLTAYDLAGRMTWSARGIPWEDFFPNQRWFAVGETLSHLEYLRNAGEIEKSCENRVYRNHIVSPSGAQKKEG